MAAGNSTLYFRGLRTGKPLTVYTYEAGSDAALARLPLDATAIATANSQKDIVFDEPMILVDFIARSTTSGVVAFVASGVRSQASLSMAAHGGTNAGRPREGYRFRPNVKYEVQVVQALDA
jgi:hypothetical protein